MLIVYAGRARGSSGRLAEGQRVYVLPFLDIVYVKNLGVSYGLFTQDGRLGQWLLSGFAVVAVALLTLWLKTGVTTRLLAVSVGLIIGGAVGNAIVGHLVANAVVTGTATGAVGGGPGVPVVGGVS
mgnify:CR=1 FL=1